MANNWKHKHPLFSESFFSKVDSPIDAEEAFVKKQCHEQSVIDYGLQIEIVDHEMSMLKDYEGNLPEYQEEEYSELENRKLKFLMSKRFHLNASRAYWYYEHMETIGSRKVKWQ